MPNKADNGDYETGYKRPPTQYQFVKGTSGNPRGRPKGSRNLRTIFNAAAYRKVTLTENGNSRSVPILEAVITQLTRKAANGELPAVRELLRFAALFEDSIDVQEDAPNPTQQQYMKNILRRLERQRDQETPESEKVHG